jgi:uncharacterized membrane protein YccC
VSQILDRLKQAEQERERVIAERKRLEAEADAALADRERDQILQQAGRSAPLPPAQPRAQTPQQQSRAAAAIAIAVAMGVVFWIGTLVPRKPATSTTPAVQAPEPARPAAREPAAAPALFKFDTDLDSFAVRAKGKE